MNIVSDKFRLNDILMMINFIDIVGECLLKVEMWCQFVEAILRMCS